MESLTQIKNNQINQIIEDVKNIQEKLKQHFTIEDLKIDFRFVLDGLERIKKYL